MLAADLPTCGPERFDFFVVSRSLAHAVIGVTTVSDGGFNPHAPARLYLRADAMADMVRRPIAPRRVAPVRAAGCLPEAACMPTHSTHRAQALQHQQQRQRRQHTRLGGGGGDAGNDGGYAAWMAVVEQEIADV